MTPASRPVPARRAHLSWAASLLLVSAMLAVSTGGGCDKSESSSGGTTPSTGPSAGSP